MTCYLKNKEIFCPLPWINLLLGERHPAIVQACKNCQKLRVQLEEFLAHTFMREKRPVVEGIPVCGALKVNVTT